MREECALVPLHNCIREECLKNLAAKLQQVQIYRKMQRKLPEKCASRGIEIELKLYRCPL